MTEEQRQTSPRTPERSERQKRQLTTCPPAPGRQKRQRTDTETSSQSLLNSDLPVLPYDIHVPGPQLSLSQYWATFRTIFRESPLWKQRDKLPSAEQYLSIPRNAARVSYLWKKHEALQKKLNSYHRSTDTCTCISQLRKREDDDDQNPPQRPQSLINNSNSNATPCF